MLGATSFYLLKLIRSWSYCGLRSAAHCFEQLLIESALDKLMYKQHSLKREPLVIYIYNKESVQTPVRTDHMVYSKVCLLSKYSLKDILEFTFITIVYMKMLLHVKGKMTLLFIV